MLWLEAIGVFTGCFSGGHMSHGLSSQSKRHWHIWGWERLSPTAKKRGMSRVFAFLALDSHTSSALVVLRCYFLTMQDAATAVVAFFGLAYSCRIQSLQQNCFRLHIHGLSLVSQVTSAINSYSCSGKISLLYLVFSTEYKPPDFDIGTKHVLASKGHAFVLTWGPKS